jgi:hypothetical protein
MKTQFGTGGNSRKWDVAQDLLSMANTLDQGGAAKRGAAERGPEVASQ